MRIPIVLLMICLLFNSMETLPTNKSDIIREIIQRYVKRAIKRGAFTESRNLLQKMKKGIFVTAALAVVTILVTISLLYNYLDVLSLTQATFLSTVLFLAINAVGTWIYYCRRIKSKAKKDTSSEVPDINEMLHVLGKLSWEALQRDTKKR